MGVQPVDLLADVGLGREQQRFLRQPVLRERDSGRREVGDLLAQPLEDGVTAAAGSR